MKLCWFHLMPYTELPEDFKERHPSVWVDIDSRLVDPARAHLMYNDFLDELELAAEVGFDGICVNEHHSNGYGLMPSPNLMAAALARRTRDAALIVMGNSLALYNPPIRVAEEFAMLDCLSGGRLVAGFPVGTPMDTCFAYGQNPSQLRDRYLEAHDLILRAWTEPDPFVFHGRYNQQRYVNPWPRPLQKPHPPIWIPGGGSVETWRWCAEKDYVYSYLSYFGYKAGEATMKGFWDEMDRLGKDRNPYRAGFLQFVGVAESSAEAFDLYREPAEYFYGRCLHIDARFAQPPGYTSEATLRAKMQSMVAQAAQGGPTTSQELSASPFEDIVERGYVIIGSPDEVAEKLREVAVNLNVGQMMLLLQFGNMSKSLATYNTRLFASEVAPQLRGLFDDRWENRWWPEPLLADARAEPREIAGDGHGARRRTGARSGTRPAAGR
jgi:alkanesulfonate monooxygenase SsuD/methylene tetrahydromethanopterin reductase-like flavin-dependent oxidoreductase (luciferase family)